jgi:membrane associated rhomboid family serine protease
MLFPIPARIFVLILGVIAFLSTIGSSGSQVAHVAHLAGMAFAWIYLRHRPKFLNVDWLGSYQQWRLRRSRRRFEVYMKKRDRQGGGPVN